MSPTTPEITAAAKILNQDHEGKTVKEVAKLVLEAAEERRQGQAKFASVGQFRLPDGALNHAVLAPFSTELQARRAGEGFAHDGKTGTGIGQFMVMPIYAVAKDAWNAVRPPALDPHEWIRESIDRAARGIIDPPATNGIYTAEYFNPEGKW